MLNPKEIGDVIDTNKIVKPSHIVPSYMRAHERLILERFLKKFSAENRLLSREHIIHLQNGIYHAQITKMELSKPDIYINKGKVAWIGGTRQLKQCSIYGKIR